MSWDFNDQDFMTAGDACRQAIVELLIRRRMPNGGVRIENKRQSIPKKLRFQVLARDGHACRYCGATASEARLQVDHVKPVSKGGTNALANLVTACQDCNLGKAASSLYVSREEHDNMQHAMLMSFVAAYGVRQLNGEAEGTLDAAFKDAIASGVSALEICRRLARMNNVKVCLYWIERVQREGGWKAYVEASDEVRENLLQESDHRYWREKWGF